jgi:hypothetical protein
MFADFLAKDGKRNESLVPMGYAIQILTSAHAQDPKITLTRRALCRSHEHRAATLDQLDRHLEAQKDWEYVLKLCDEEMGPFPNRSEPIRYCDQETSSSQWLK